MMRLSVRMKLYAGYLLVILIFLFALLADFETVTSAGAQGHGGQYIVWLGAATAVAGLRDWLAAGALAHPKVG